jgi:ATP-binding cassette subfamily F protein uup
MITHDRYFLDRVVNQIIELDRGSLYLYKGNYSYYLEKKIEREDMEQSSELKRQRLLKKELAWLRKGAKARSTKQKARIDRYHKLNDQPVLQKDEQLQISVPSSRLGKKTIELEQVCKAFDGTKVIDNFSFKLARDDRVGIIGPNGSGKSTLLNILCGQMQPDSGTVDIGETVKIGLYSQEMQHIDGNLRVIEYIREGAEYLSTAEGYKISASQMLERFLFPPDLQWSLIAKLSGGEKRRLYLLRVLMEAPNILLLDEPTNDLDIATLNILEDYLDDFNGAVLAASHDRYFLDRITEKILSFEGDGHIEQYTGDYSDYRAKRSAQTVDKADKTITNSMALPRQRGNRQEEQREKTKLKFTYQEQKEYAEIDDIIAGLEDEINQRQSQINESATDYVLLQQLVTGKDVLEKQLQEKLDRWVYLNELAEKITKGTH